MVAERGLCSVATPVATEGEDGTQGRRVLSLHTEVNPDSEGGDA
jgi:hypothetical protein